MGKKAKTAAGDFPGRFREIMSDPNNAYIPKAARAGQVVDNYVIMHNGIKVLLGQHAY